MCLGSPGPSARGQGGGTLQADLYIFPLILMLKDAGWRVEEGDNEDFLAGYHGNKEITGVDKQVKSIRFFKF